MSKIIVKRGCIFDLTSGMVLLTITFLLLKVFDKIDWSYWIVFMPLWLPVAIGVAILLLILLVMLFFEIHDRHRYGF